MNMIKYSTSICEISRELIKKIIFKNPNGFSVSSVSFPWGQPLTGPLW